MRVDLPRSAKGLRVGLLGGSFDPPHVGHLHISKEALKRLSLDRIWWLVSPGNPLKPKAPVEIGRRLQAARQLATHPRISVTDIEEKLQVRYTADTIRHLLRLYLGTRFVWLMGADNLAQFHHWQQWQDIMESVPIAVMARPGQRISARSSPAATIFREHRLPTFAAQTLVCRRAPSWCFLNVPMRSISSSAIRARGDWGTTPGHDNPTCAD